MKSLLSLLRIRRSPLQIMSDDSNGLYPFPVEIWQEIFSKAAESSDKMAEKNQGHHRLASWFSPNEIENLINDPIASESHHAFKNRLNIILVCKSWYLIGIPALWSHLKLKEIDDRQLATTVYRILKHNPALGPHVVRLTIVPHRAPRFTDITSANQQSIAEIIPLLTNIKAISCPSHVAVHLPRSLRLETAVIHAAKHANAPHAFWRDEFPIHPHFWYHCRTLSISLIQTTYAQQHPPPQIIFPNLTRLRLVVESSVSLAWVSSAWSFPVLEHLSISSKQLTGWDALFQRVHMALETLQLSIRIKFDVSTGTIEMPRLREVHLITQGAKRNITPWHRAIKAPVLHRYVHYIDPSPVNRVHASAVLFNSIRKVRDQYPLVTEIGIVFQEEGKEGSYYVQDQIVITNADIAALCLQGLSVDIMAGMQREKRKFSSESFSQGDDFLSRAEVESSMALKPF